MATDVDIVNRALQLIGTRTTVDTMAEKSNEAIQASLVYAIVVDWCLSVANWNFARKTAALTVTKTAPASGNWSAASPSPPWAFEYAYPTDCIRTIYLTNALRSATATKWLGEPQRFVVVHDAVGVTAGRQILTDQTPAYLIYTARVIAPDLWPAYFERFVVATLAKTLGLALTGDQKLAKELEGDSLNFFRAAESANRTEGLLFHDTTPEWIQAIGIPYPYRRYASEAPPPAPKGQANDDGN